MPRTAMDAALEDIAQQKSDARSPSKAVDKLLPKSEMPALDDDATATLAALFSNLCTFSNLEPKGALAVLNAQEWPDANDLSSHIRQGA
jgi:hypothetical protein